jgi:hypothetical protein
MVNIKNEIDRMWAHSAPLTATTALMLAALVASIAGLVVDPRIITGAPAWLKPAKFAISSAIFAGTIAWLFRYLTVWPGFVRAMGWILALALVLEVGIIDVQAARGTASHFNVATPLDQVLFGVMGVGIGILWLASAGVMAALFRQTFQDHTWGTALRLGMLVTVLGSAAGGMMLRPAPQPAHVKPTKIGGHTVGAADGGPGLPGVGWSEKHGDLRIPHFLGLHGIQIVPLLTWLMARRRRIGSGLVAVIAASYSALIAILMWQALRGQSIVEPDGATWATLAIWLASTIAAATIAWTPTRYQNNAPSHGALI